MNGFILFNGLLGVFGGIIGFICFALFENKPSLENKTNQEQAKKRK